MLLAQCFFWANPMNYRFPANVRISDRKGRAAIDLGLEGSILGLGNQSFWGEMFFWIELGGGKDVFVNGFGGLGEWGGDRRVGVVMESWRN